MPLFVHITDLHLDHWPQNLAAMIELVRDIPADVFLVGGDNGGDDGIAQTIAALRGLRPQAAIAWVMGNHDLWRKPYTHVWNNFGQLTAVYLERQNLDRDDCTVVGTYGHYDYSGGDPSIPTEVYESFRWGTMVWNDRFIDRLGRTNPEIALELTDRFRARFQSAVDRGRPIVLLTHTWPVVPEHASQPSFVTAYLVNHQVGAVVRAAPVRPVVGFCGHTHRPARSDHCGFPIINTGSDYRQVRITQWALPSALAAVEP